MSQTQPRMARTPPAPPVATATDEEPNGLRVYCRACLKAWTLTTLPVAVRRLSELAIKTRCPECGGRDIVLEV